MRTTLTIDDDVLVAARAIADQQHKSIGDVISELARRSLYKPGGVSARNGIPLLTTRAQGSVITPDLVNALRDEQP